eukprot:11319180-Ditylum_brightwellii.AAC.1
MVKILEEESFPFLDIGMRWKSGELLFQVYHKKNQQLKYVEHLSTHRQSTFKSITTGALMQLGRLTSRTTDLEPVKLNPIYPDHAKALTIADVAPEEFPTFREIWKKEDENLTDQEKKKRRDRCTIYFALGYSNFIQEANILKLIRALWKR